MEPSSGPSPKSSWTVIPGSGDCFILELAEPDEELSDHFPGSVLVPGFVQLDWVGAILLDRLGARGIAEFRDVKFLQPITPPCRVEARVKLRSDGTAADFALSVDTVVATKGSVSVTSASSHGVP